MTCDSMLCVIGALLPNGRPQSSHLTTAFGLGYLNLPMMNRVYIGIDI
jgi:hypothetical protein